ncbi:hypothetical protein SERLADRAFT_404538 [Serpula lacrymans var. lacrymans S7.9]|uniref:DUF6532 domain-containing protein n=1 Tax=Serpula lacrymans var. lacrymans (strain S7.9) TaxID=578457 RepID=F8NDG8_SERL9|nr:uncharacterized protein SERLADRAFT_404538 [Serpula lacrymans var. lacrymans S7.9]EGO30306.1 hypothetical protein SERLADRAFT_404538 [Serpula lacrymans var. lacrymans S7.9]
MFNSGEWAHSVNSLLTSVTSTNDYLDKSLASVVARCWRMTSKDIARCQDLPQPKPSKKQFEQWHAMGCKFAAILAGATVSGQLVISRIIPTISSLCQNLPLNMNCMFAPGVLSYYGLPANIDCKHFEASDQIFKAIWFNTFQLLDHCLDCWGVCTTSLVHFLTPLSDLDNILPHSQPPSPSLPPVVLPEMYVVSTTFQNMAEGNRQYSAPRDPGANYEWTESEREKASRAIKVTNVEDLTAKIQKHYDGGVRTNPSAYFSMPESIRTTLLPYFQSCLGSTTSLHHVDSAVKGEGFTFQALHFSWYNRHCTKLVPYTSKEIQDHANIYQKLKTVFADLFEWINEMLATYLPAKYLVLRQHAESLPGNNASAVCPFLGLVVNINVSTKAHRDAKDKLFCLVIPLDVYQLFDPEFVTNNTSVYLFVVSPLRRKLKAQDLDRTKLRGDANADRLVVHFPDIRQKAAHMVDAEDDEEEGDLDRPDIDSEDEPLHKRARNSMEEELEDEDEDALMQTFRCLTGKRRKLTASYSLTFIDPGVGQSLLRTNGLIIAYQSESVWLINVNRKMNSNSSPSLTPSRDSKAIITSFSPTSSRLAKAGHSQMCVILSTVKGFPGTDEQDELVWNAIIKVASSSSLFKTTIVDLENARNKQKKGRIVDYVWAAAAQLRGEVKQKARILILSEYTLKNKLSEEVHTIGEWLLSSRKGVFTFGGLDVFQKPFGHHIIKLLLQIQWFHKKGEGVRYPSDFKDSPLPLIALTVTAIKNCLHELAKGVHTTLNFSEQVYRPRLEELQRKTPRWFLQFCKNTYNNILQQCDLQCLNAQEDNWEDEVDFVVLEDSASL